MKKALRIVAVSAVIVSIVSAVVLGFIYLENIAVHFQNLKARIVSKKDGKKYIGGENEYE